MPERRPGDISSTGMRPVRRRGLDLTIAPEAAHVAPGERLMATLHVQNFDDIAHDCRIAIAGLPRAWYDVDASCVALAPAATELIGLTIHPPSAPPVQNGLYLAGVELTVDDDPAIRASDTIEVMVGDGPILDMTLTPSQVTGRSAVFDVTVHNRMAWPAPVALDVSDAEGALVFHVTPHSVVMVQPGDTGRVRVRAVPAARLRGNAPRSFDITMGARLPGQREGHAVTERHVRFTHAPNLLSGGLPAWGGRMPRWAIIVPLILVLVLLAGVAERMLATRSSHTVARPGISAGAARPPRVQTPIAPPDFLLNPTQVDLGRGRHRSSTAVIHVVNLGVRPLRIEHIAVIGEGAHDFVTRTTCTRSAISAEADCIIRVRFTARAGRLSRALLTISIPGAGIVRRVPLTGRG